MDRELALLRKDYFTIKRYVRNKKIGPTAPAKTKTFSNGLLRIATLLAYNNIPVRYIHYYSLDQILLTESIPEIVAFSAVCPTIPRCAELAKAIKKISPNTKIVVGGVHINQALDETRNKFPIFDMFNTGYELTAAEQLAGQTLHNINEPYVDYCLLPYPLYEYSINTFTTLGCPFHCDYCADGLSPHLCTMSDGQLGIMKKTLPERTLIHFFDSILGYNREGAFKVCEQLEKLNHNFVLSCDMRADIMNPKLAQALERAGFVEIRMGLDTASDEILKKNNRTIMPETFIKQLKMIRNSSNLYISLYSITGLPGTTSKLHDITLDCIEYLHESHLVDEIKNAIYVPYPMLGVNYESRGVYITDHDWSHYDRSSYPVYHLEQLTEQEIWELFIKTAKWINQCWLKNCSFDSVLQIPKTENEFQEYYESNYFSKK